eukprot:2198349-Prymnesium_polylepis.1
MAMPADASPTMHAEYADDQAYSEDAPANTEDAGSADASAPAGDGIPDYNARLGYGTDQGRWLMEQVSAKQDGEGGAKRRARPTR